MFIPSSRQSQYLVYINAARYIMHLQCSKFYLQTGSQLLFKRYHIIKYQVECHLVYISDLDIGDIICPFSPKSVI